MNKFLITDEYGYKYPKILKKVLKKVLKLENVKNAFFEIIFVDEKKIQEINKTYRNIDKITDVISFAFEDNDKRVYNKTRILGEIYICIPRMIEQAQTYGYSQTRELCFLSVHGLLHLLGYDHIKKDEETQMFQKQELILNEFRETKRTKSRSD